MPKPKKTRAKKTKPIRSTTMKLALAPEWDIETIGKATKKRRADALAVIKKRMIVEKEDISPDYAIVNVAVAVSQPTPFNRCGIINYRAICDIPVAIIQPAAIGRGIAGNNTISYRPVTIGKAAAIVACRITSNDTLADSPIDIFQATTVQRSGIIPDYTFNDSSLRAVAEDTTSIFAAITSGYGKAGKSAR